MLVGINSYYGYSHKKELANINEDSRFFDENGNLQELGNVRSIELHKENLLNGIILEKYNKKFHNQYDLIVFWEIPNLIELFKVTFRNLFKRVKVFLIIEDTPIARSRNILLLPFLFNKIILNTEDKKFKFRHYETFTFCLPTLPSVEKIKELKSFILNSTRLNKINYIASNKSSINNKGTFIFRRKLVEDLNINQKKYFDLFGNGWHKRQIPMDLPLLMPLIARSKIIRSFIYFLINIRPSFIESKGTVRSKSNTLNNYDFTLAIDPYLGKPSIVLEKLFDPMLAGSIPIYCGPQLPDIPRNCYLRINSNTTSNEIINIISQLSLEDKNQYRKNIYNFLISEKAEKYRYSFYAKFLTNIFKKDIQTMNKNNLV